MFNTLRRLLPLQQSTTIGFLVQDCQLSIPAVNLGSLHLPESPSTRQAILPQANGFAVFQIRLWDSFTDEFLGPLASFVRLQTTAAQEVEIGNVFNKDMSFSRQGGVQSSLLAPWRCLKCAVQPGPPGAPSQTSAGTCSLHSFSEAFQRDCTTRLGCFLLHSTSLVSSFLTLSSEKGVCCIVFKNCDYD